MTQMGTDFRRLHFSKMIPPPWFVSPRITLRSDKNTAKTVVRGDTNHGGRLVID
jgi:hypothetical protein